jgi:DNA-binding SARP family transcriptional activator/DNA-binding beta-propeller fold protein YncE
MVEFRILGPLQLLVGGEERPVPGEKQQALLARLLLEPNRPVSTERLIDDLWGEHAPATVRASLHAHVTRLRRVLADADGSSPLVNDGHGYVLRVAESQIDATRFRALVAEARRADLVEDARERYAAALGLWRGPVLDGVELGGADAERAELEGLRLSALEERIDADLTLGRSSELVPELERHVAAEPLRERLWAQLMLALYADGRQADALAAYQRARVELDAVGLVPGRNLRELERRILEQDPELATAPAPAGRRGSARRRPGRWLALGVAAVVVAVVMALVVRHDDAPIAVSAPVAPRTVADRLVEIDPATNRVVSVTPVGHGPDSMAMTDDAIWVANHEDRTVARVALPSREVRVIGGAPVAYQLVSGLNGDVWLSSFEERLVTLVAPRGEVPSDVKTLAAGPRRVRLPGSGEGLATGGGFLWVTSPRDSGGRDAVFQIDLRDRRVVSSFSVGHLPLFVTFGYGSAWVANYKGDSVSIIRPGVARPETVRVGGGPLGIASGEGGIWVVTFWNRRLVRIDPETRRVLARIPVGAGPLSVAVGAGSVWVTNRDERTITRVDPRTDKVAQTIQLDSAPYGIRFGHGRIWVTTQSCGSMGC